jgi:hypothetical protein
MVTSSVVDPDPHWFWSPGSGPGSTLGMRIRIQNQAAKNDLIKEKKKKKSIVLKCWMFSVEI